MQDTLFHVSGKTRYESTEQYADRQGVKPQSVRARLCRTGSYFGDRPVKAPNGRLRWPTAVVEG